MNAMVLVPVSSNVGCDDRVFLTLKPFPCRYWILPGNRNHWSELHNRVRSKTCETNADRKMGRDLTQK